MVNWNFCNVVHSSYSSGCIFRMLGIIELELFVRLTVAVMVAFFVCWASLYYKCSFFLQML